jgi:isopentenyl phosphate kinase
MRKPDAAPLIFGDVFLSASKTKYQAIISSKGLAAQTLEIP